MLHRRVGDQEEYVQPLECNLQALVVVVVSLPENSLVHGQAPEFFRTPSDKHKLLRWKTWQEMLDGAPANTSCSRENSDGGGIHLGFTRKTQSMTDLVEVSCYISQLLYYFFFEYIEHIPGYPGEFVRT
jgi:hypothetical protein